MGKIARHATLAAKARSGDGKTARWVFVYP
jgi:hypothetical protein